jgi:hypothetical protein
MRVTEQLRAEPAQPALADPGPPPSDHDHLPVTTLGLHKP